MWTNYVLVADFAADAEPRISILAACSRIFSGMAREGNFSQSEIFLAWQTLTSFVSRYNSRDLAPVRNEPLRETFANRSILQYCPSADVDLV